MQSFNKQLKKGRDAIDFVLRQQCLFKTKYLVL